jgi:hypothetical protein
MTTKNFGEFYDEIYSQDFGGKTPSEPHGWIQWKGTAVCADLYCKCGEHSHIDEEFFYFYRCPKCGTIYAVGQNIKLIELTPQQVECVNNERAGLIHTGS